MTNNSSRLTEAYSTAVKELEDVAAAVEVAKHAAQAAMKEPSIETVTEVLKAILDCSDAGAGGVASQLDIFVNKVAAAAGIDMDEAIYRAHVVPFAA